MKYEVTAIRYQFPLEWPLEERTKRAEELVKRISDGTELILRAEPDNERDPNAVAVYINYVKRIGYISAGELEEIHQLLDKNGEAVAVAAGNDGHVTMYVEIEDKVGIKESTVFDDGARQIAPLPFTGRVMLPLRDEERGLQVIEHNFLEMDAVQENASELLKMARIITKLLCQTTLCKEDIVFLRKAERKVCKIMSLKYRYAEEQDLKMLKEALLERISDFHSSVRRIEIFNELRAKLREYGKAYLLPQYNKVYLSNKENLEQVKEDEKKRLKQWLDELPDGILKRDSFVSNMYYKKLSRRELYDIMSVIIVLEHIVGKVTLGETERNAQSVVTTPDDDLAEKIKQCFYGNNDKALEFIMKIKGMKPTEITAYVNKLTDDIVISKSFNGTDLWRPLNEAGYYHPSIQNWNNQVE